MINPIKITPDRLKDTIIEIRYTSSVPFEILVGLFYQNLDDTYTYTNQPISNNNLNFPKDFFLGKELIPREVTLNLAKNNIFFTENFKVRHTYIQTYYL